LSVSGKIILLKRVVGFAKPVQYSFLLFIILPLGERADISSYLLDTLVDTWTAIKSAK
jgi:hypothetical protein